MYRRALVPTILLLCASLGAAATDHQYKIPRINGVHIDGDNADWAGRGFEIQLFTQANGKVLHPRDFDSTLTLAWDGDAILVYACVQDDSIRESADSETPENDDGLSLLLASKDSDAKPTKIRLAPTFVGDASRVQIQIQADSGELATAGISVQAESKRLDGGYAIEARLQPEKSMRTNGRSAEFQLAAVFHEIDEADQKPVVYRWPAGADLASLRTGRETSAPIAMAAVASVDDRARAVVRVIGASALSGKPLTMTNGDAVARGAFAEVEGRPVAELSTKLPPNGSEAVAYLVAEGGARLPVAMPDPAESRARLLITADIRPDRYVFSGGNFPRCDFADPWFGEQLLGKYSVKSQYFDERFNPVTRADAPGRYGVAITITPEAGAPVTRFRTLYCAPPSWTGFRWWFTQPEGTVAIPEVLGVNAAQAETYAHDIADYLQEALREGTRDSESLAVLLCAMTSGRAIPATTSNTGARAQDRQWWVKLKRILYKSRNNLDVDFVSPFNYESPPAPTLREGTDVEAGMKPGAGEALRALLRTWEAESGEPFAVAIARNGVVFLHEAYGTRGGVPLTVDTPSWMASITKLMSGVLMMMFVEKGLIDLDASVDTYLPALRYTGGARPVTIRDLYTHTNGFNIGLELPNHYPDHWGDEMHDLEEVLQGYWPFLKPVTGVGYNGVGYALAGKAMELVSGEALPLFFQHHLLDPLGMKHTTTPDASARAFSTPMDIAKLGQMLLNRGAYGSMRFFSAETFEKILPAPLVSALGPETTAVWGIGTYPMPEPGLGARTYGHGAASSAILRIDPDNQLVVVMTRNTGGPRYGEFAKRFFETIGEHLPK